MENTGLVNLLEMDRSIVADIKYGTSDNFTGQPLYTVKFGVYLQPEIAKAVVEVNKRLREIYPTRRVIVFDAARPLSVQKKMYEAVKGSPYEAYIANPYGEYPGGFHNYGLAVDLSITDLNEGELDMGTPYDSFSEAAHTGDEAALVKRGVLSRDAYANRMLLYSLTGEQGLKPHPNEWWHYQTNYSEDSKAGYQLLDF